MRLPKRAKLEAVVDVVEIYREADFVHSANFKEIISSRHHACRRHCAALMRHAKKIAVADITIDPVAKGVRGRKAGPRTMPPCCTTPLGQTSNAPTAPTSYRGYGSASPRAIDHREP